MSFIKLCGIIKKENKITFDFSFSDSLKKYFKSVPFFIEYPDNICGVPDSVAAVPFVSSVLPIIWLSDSELYLPYIDKAFYDCIPEVKKGYEKMFPGVNFAGKIIAEKIVDCSYDDTGKAAAFFSGGVDAVQTLISHISEKPDLISIWGSDIKYDNDEGWKKVHDIIDSAISEFDLKNVVIRSSFRAFDDERMLHKDFYPVLGDGWWHGVKHGIALLGHAAPYAFIHKISCVYIASTFAERYGIKKCASSPYTDNFVRFCGAQVFHDGAEYSRQDKIRNIVDYSRAVGHAIPLHVCWESQSGNNCCKCEKCYRTMCGLMVECASPDKFGFENSEKSINNIRINIVNIKDFLSFSWVDILKRGKENIHSIKKNGFYKKVGWLAKYDFNKLKNIKYPFVYRIRDKLSHFSFYQKLHEWKYNLKQ